MMHSKPIRPRVLHASFQRFWAPGIVAQVEAEQAAAKELSIDWTSRIFTAPTEDQSLSEVVVGASAPGSRGASRGDFYNWLRSMLQTERFDLLLLRHLTAAVAQVRLIKATNVPVFLVHHTLEVPELTSSGGLKGHAKGLLEKITGHESLRSSAGIVAVTPEIANYERRRGLKASAPAFMYPNGILTSDSQILDDCRGGDVPILIFVASYFSAWHGLDRLLSAARASNQPFIIHVVGAVDAEDLKQISNDRRFVAHGVLGRNQISALMQQSWLGLSSFALDRKEMKQACTLKVREYLASGVPVYCGHDDIFEEEFVYAVRGPCSIDHMLQVARRARAWTRLEVAVASRPYIDKRILLGKLYDGLAAHFADA